MGTTLRKWFDVGSNPIGSASKYMNNKEEYIRLTKELLQWRKRPEYTEEIEDKYMDELDGAYMKLTKTERDEINSINFNAGS